MKPPKVEFGVTATHMNPKIYIVFRLLTFFMIAINFEKTKADERVKLPIDALAKTPESKLDNELVLNVGFNRQRDGTIVGAPVIFYNGDPVALDKILPKLQEEATIFK